MTLQFVTGWRCLGSCSVSFPERPEGDGCPVCRGDLLRVRIPDADARVDRPDERGSERRVLKAAGL